jgi:hypothetical protein
MKRKDRSIENAFQVFKHRLLDRGIYSFTTAQATAITGLEKRRIYTICHTLLGAGVMTHDYDTRTYTWIGYLWLVARVEYLFETCDFCYDKDQLESEAEYDTRIVLHFLASQTRELKQNHVFACLLEKSSCASKRRLYDTVNILKGLGMIENVGKNYIKLV